MNNSNSLFRLDLQGLRAIAILLVVLAHSQLDILPGGFIGVDVFFILSGYLISGLLLRELWENDRILFLKFYTRRLKRLLPALLLMLCLTFGMAIFLLSDFEARKQLASAPYSLTWTSNIYFAFTSFDYFDELSNKDLFLHTWSLGVEEQFYLIWPVVLVILFKAGKILTLDKKSMYWLILAGLGASCCASFFLSLYWTRSNPEAAFYLMPARIWQLSLGSIVYVISEIGPIKNSRIFSNKFLNILIFGLGLSLILGSALALSPNLAYPGYWALIPSFGTALIIMSSHGIPNNNPLAHPVLVWLGDRSYSLYLWHWPIFILGFSLGYQGKIIPTIILMLLSMGAAILSYRLIEYPFWKGKLSSAPPSKTLLISILSMSVGLFVLSQGIRQIPDPIDTQIRADKPQIYKMSCDSFTDSSELNPCIFEALFGSKKTVVLLGDSIGAQWFSMIPEIYPEPTWRTIVFTKSACAIVDEDYFYKLVGGIYQVCTDWRNAVLDELDVIKPDILFIGSASSYKFSEDQWVEGSSRIFKRASRAAKVTYVLPGTPGLTVDGPGCISK